MRGDPADEVMRDPELLEFLVQPFGHALVAMAVAQKRKVMLRSAGIRRGPARVLMRTGPFRRPSKKRHRSPRDSVKPFTSFD